jgi:Spy/CpxP family protein refolding chaperone
MKRLFLFLVIAGVMVACADDKSGNSQDKYKNMTLAERAFELYKEEQALEAEIEKLTEKEREAVYANFNVLVEKYEKEQAQKRFAEAEKTSSEARALAERMYNAERYSDYRAVENVRAELEKLSQSEQKAVEYEYFQILQEKNMGYERAEVQANEADYYYDGSVTGECVQDNDYDYDYDFEAPVVVEACDYDYDFEAPLIEEAYDYDYDFEAPLIEEAYDYDDREVENLVNSVARAINNDDYEALEELEEIYNNLSDSQQAAFDEAIASYL